MHRDLFPSRGKQKKHLRHGDDSLSFHYITIHIDNTVIKVSVDPGMGAYKTVWSAMSVPMFNTLVNTDTNNDHRNRINCNN